MTLNLANRIGRLRTHKLELMKPSKNITAPRFWVPGKATLALAAVYSVVLLGCHPDMWNQPRFTALQKNTFFADSAADRLPVENTVQYEGALRKWNAPVFAALSGQERVPGVLDEAFWTGKEGAGFKADNYFKVDIELLKRGQDRFNAICTPCHGEGGYGNGVVTHRGFPIAASYHIDRLREVEDGYIVDVIKNGFGRMYSYNARVSAEDRWAIVAYIRALQYSQNVPKGSLDAADQQGLEKALQPQSEAVEHDVADHNAH
jgi:mono/diheme cytochrome c family protein